MTKNRICDLFAAAMLMLALTAATLSAHAQTYTDLFDFDGTRGSSPQDPQLLAQGQDGNLYGTTAYGGSNDLGVVFRMSPSGAISALYSFDGPHGERPWGGLTLGTDGNFYGTTVRGGDHQYGTVFQITPGGNLTVLYSFTDGSDGAYPYATPVQGTDGNFYGVTQSATAYKITPSGTFKLLGSIPGASVAPLIQGTDGSFYGTSQVGGKFGFGSVFKMTPAGKVKIVYSFDVTHGSTPIGPVVQGSDGNYYGTTMSGGTSEGGVVFKLTPGGVLKVLHNFVQNTGSDGASPLAGPVFATDGNIYGVTPAGGNVGPRYGVIFKTTSTGTYSVLYDFDKSHGASANATPMQHTNGKIYSLTLGGGTHGYGVAYNLDLSLNPFVKLVFSSGKVGKTVEVLGGGLTGAISVKFNGTSAKFNVVSDTYLTATVPAGATTGPVTVKTPGGTLTSSTKFRVTPVIKSFNPTSGKVGTPVTITGTSFTGTTKVTFGGVKATTFTVNSDTQVTANVPTGAKTGKITITTPGGTATSSGVFTVTQ